jgi:hypothetical protein
MPQPRPAEEDIHIRPSVLEPAAVAEHRPVPSRRPHCSPPMPIPRHGIGVERGSAGGFTTLRCDAASGTLALIVARSTLQRATVTSLSTHLATPSPEPGADDDLDQASTVWVSGRRWTSCVTSSVRRCGAGRNLDGLPQPEIGCCRSGSAGSTRAAPDHWFDQTTEVATVEETTVYVSW